MSEKKEEVKVDRELHKYIVGTKGSVIQELQKKTGATIKVPGADDKSDKITISGTADQVKNAKKEISTIVDQHKSVSDYDLEKETKETEKVFQKYQKEVDKHAHARNDFFEKSKEAFAKGDKAAAKELSEKGKKEGELMEAAQRKASKEVFEKKNHEYKDHLTIDLHGLHVDDAIHFLEERMKLLANKKYHGKTFRIICGAGIHSDESGAKIKPAVKTFLGTKKHAFTEPNHGNIELIL